MKAPLVIAPDGACFLGRNLLHPADDPLAAAKADLERLLQRARGNDTVVLVGSGLGWHARAVLDHEPRPRLVIYEESPERLALMRCLGPGLSEFDLARTAGELTEILAQRLVYDQPGKAALFCPQAYKTDDSEMHALAGKLLNQTLERSHVNQRTTSRKGGLWLRNLAANFRQVLNIPDITLLEGVFEGMPACVVGAGPSLDQSLAGLKSLGHKALLLGAASAMIPLASVDRSLDLAVALEGSDESRQFAGKNMEQTVLAAASTSHANHFERWPGPISIFHLQPWLTWLAGLGQVLPTGGHATSAAFTLAVLLGCDPIILVAQDLAYTGGRIHASNRPGGEDEQRPEMLAVPAIGGGTTQTSQVMQSYLGWYSEAAQYLSHSQPQRRFLNCTAAGASIKGFMEVDLLEVVSGLPDLDEETGLLSQAVPRLPLASAEVTFRRLSRLGKELENALALVEREGPGAMSQAPDSSGLLAQIRENAEPGWGMGEYRERLLSLCRVLTEMRDGCHG